MSFASKRMNREAKSVQVMIEIYCQDHHQPAPLCPECENLLNYALKRLQSCPFQAQKPTCAKCSVHCYKPEMQQKIRQVMRHAGPKLIWSHPIMAVQHLIDGLKKSPVLK